MVLSSVISRINNLCEKSWLENEGVSCHTTVVLTLAVTPQSSPICSKHYRKFWARTSSLHLLLASCALGPLGEAQRPYRTIFFLPPIPYAKNVRPERGSMKAHRHAMTTYKACFSFCLLRPCLAPGMRL